MARIKQFFRELLCWHKPVAVDRIERKEYETPVGTVIVVGRTFYACEKCGKFPVYKRK